MTNVLVVFFSRTGNTHEVAHELADIGGWDCEAIRDRTRRGGLLGYLRSGFEAARARPVAIAPLAHDLAAYDLVVVGTPVWNFSLSSPVRTFLERYRDQLPRVAFFVTCGGRGGARVLAQMTEVAQRQPVATLILTRRDLEARPTDELEDLVAAVQHALGTKTAPPAPSDSASISPSG